MHVSTLLMHVLVPLPILCESASLRPSSETRTSASRVNENAIGSEARPFVPTSARTKGGSNEGSQYADVQSQDIPPTGACWASSLCKTVMTAFEECYKISGNLKEPDPEDKRNTQSNMFQSSLCSGRHYNDIMLQTAKNPAGAFQPCLECFKQAGVDIDSEQSPAKKLKWKLYDFCHTNEPNLYDLLEHLRQFMAAADGPTNPLTERVKSMQDKYPSTGMNKPTTTPANDRPNETGPQQAWWESPLTVGGLIPTEYLGQLPAKWPYTGYGVVRKAGKTTSWPFVNPRTTTKTVAWLYHSILWNPRPLYTPASEKAGGNVTRAMPFSPYLTSWTHAFIYETITSSSMAPTTTVPDSTTYVTSFRSTDVTTTITKTNSASRNVSSPAITQPPSSSKDFREAGMGFAMPSNSERKTNTKISVIPDGPALSELWDKVQSMHSKFAS